jgi:hypothetical protein
MVYYIVYRSRRTTKQLYKQEPSTAGHGFISVRDGQEEITYEVGLSERDLDSMARKAAGNRSGESKDGPLRVRVVSRKRL